MPHRPELGVLLDRTLRAVIAGELPILERHGVDMWGYAVLSALGDGPAATQAELSAATGRDKTRLIGNLDRLEADGLIVRRPDPRDRRNRVVELTSDGRRVLAACRREIAAMERGLLAAVPAADRAGFERALLALAEQGRSLPRRPGRSASGS